MFKTILSSFVVALVAATVVSAQPVKDYKWDVDQDIPDLGELSNTQTVPDDMSGLNTIADVDVDLHIDHTWQGDLIVDISHNGVTVPLLYRPGDSDPALEGLVSVPTIWELLTTSSSWMTRPMSPMIRTSVGATFLIRVLTTSRVRGFRTGSSPTEASEA